MHLLLTWTIGTASAWSLHTTDDGDVVRWPEFPVRYQMDTSPSDPVEDASNVVAAAFDAWEVSPDENVAFSASPDSENRIYFTRNWPFDPDLLAMTSVSSDEEGNLVAFEIRINAHQPWSIDGSDDAYDLQAALAHEVGHVLGIEHSEVERATMFASMGFADIERRVIDTDDREALEFLYMEPEPAEPSAPSTPLPITCSTGGTASGWLALFGLLAIRRRV